MQNLRDKLLKAGKIDKKQKKRGDQRARQSRQRKGRSRGHVNAQEAEANRQAVYEAQLAEQRERDQKLAELERLEREARERNLRIRHIIDYYSVRIRPGRERWFFMAHDQTIHFIPLRDDDAYRLQTGKLAIVQRPDPKDDDDAFAVVPRETALDLWKIDPNIVRFFNRPSTTLESHPTRWFEVSHEEHAYIWNTSTETLEFKTFEHTPPTP